MILNHASILNQQIHTTIFYSHPVIHLHANISFHFHKCSESNVVVLTMMMSLWSQIKPQITFQHANTPSVSLNVNVHSIHREDILKPSSKLVSLDRIHLTFPFHPSTYILHHTILKHYKTLMTDQDTNDILKLLPITSYKRERNLCNHLAHVSEPQPPMFSDTGTFTCKRRRCNTCKFITNWSAIR